MVALATLVTIASNLKAQNPFNSLIKSTGPDATILLKSYAEPLFKGFGIGLNSGWNNTAETDKLLHFDLRITVNFANVPSNERSFDVTQIGLSNHVVLDPSSPTKIAPTYGGSSSAALPIMDIKDDNGNKVGSFTMPKGQLQYVPAPNVQLVIGLVYNTDVTIRATPNINLGAGAGTVGLIGFGIKHNVIKDFAALTEENVMPFDLALAINYNKITYTNQLNVQPESGTTPSSGSSSDFSNQRLSGNFTGTNFQAIISKKILFATPFVAIAYQTAKTDVGILGNYPVSSSVGHYQTITDPVHINETSINGVRIDSGVQLNFSFLRAYFSISESKYLSANAGIGIGL